MTDLYDQEEGLCESCWNVEMNRHAATHRELRDDCEACLTIAENQPPDAPVCGECGHVHEAPGRECGFSLDRSLEGLVRHWCECHAPTPEPVTPDLEEARFDVLDWELDGEDADMRTAFEESVARLTTAALEAGRAEERQASEARIRALREALDRIRTHEGQGADMSWGCTFCNSVADAALRASSEGKE